MKAIFAIMRRELISTFSTWTGYWILAAAMLLNGLLFNASALGQAPKYSSEVLSSFFLNSSGVGAVACVLLAMRLIAEEKQTKSLVLLFTSPLSERQIIWGKFLAAFLVFALLNILSFHLPALVLLEGRISWGQIFAGYLGSLLLGSAVLAMALFCSAIAPNQLLAGVAAAALVVFFLLLWLLAFRVDSPLKEIFTYMAIYNERFRPFGLGIIHIKDVVYYLSLCIFFLEAATRVLEERRARG